MRARFEVHGGIVTLCEPGKSASVFYFKPICEGSEFGRAMEDVSPKEKRVVGPALGGCGHLKNGVYLMIHQSGLLKFLRKEYQRLKRIEGSVSLEERLGAGGK